MIRLGEGLYTWGRFNTEKGFNFNGFLFSGPGGAVLVDPPPLSDEDRAYWDGLALRPDILVITNRNHVRARDEFLKRGLIPTAMHEAEVEQSGIAVDRRLAHGETLPPGLAVIHLPGKSPGEIGLHWAERGVLMLGDALIAPHGELALIPESKLDDPARLRASLRTLAGLSFDILLLADGEPILREAKPRVMRFLDGLAR